MIQTVFEQLQKQPDGNWLFAYTSDHGQYVRKDTYNQGNGAARQLSRAAGVVQPG